MLTLMNVKILKSLNSKSFVNVNNSFIVTYKLYDINQTKIYIISWPKYFSGNHANWVFIRLSEAMITSTKLKK